MARSIDGAAVRGGRPVLGPAEQRPERPAHRRTIDATLRVRLRGCRALRSAHTVHETHEQIELFRARRVL